MAYLSPGNLLLAGSHLSDVPLRWDTPDRTEAQAAIYCAVLLRRTQRVRSRESHETDAGRFEDLPCYFVAYGNGKARSCISNKCSSGFSAQSPKAAIR